MYIPPVISLQIEMSLAVFSGDCRPLYLHVLHVQLAVHDHELHQNLQTPDLLYVQKAVRVHLPNFVQLHQSPQLLPQTPEGKWWLVNLVSPLRERGGLTCD